MSYNMYDPAFIALGGDDCSLKLWHLSRSNSIQSQPTTANICAVRFQPGTRYNLAFGSAGNYYWDRLTPYGMNNMTKFSSLFKFLSVKFCAKGASAMLTVVCIVV